MRRFKVWLLILLFVVVQALPAGKFNFMNKKAMALDNGLALTPPMGWNSWNKFGGNIDEWKIMAMADAMVANGMKDAGYEYINIDDNWMAKTRDDNGYYQADPTRFPDGIKYVADYVHSKGLKLGIYSSNGTRTCMGLPGGQFNEEKDAQKYAEWGVDYLKYDFCYNVRPSTYAPNIDNIIVGGKTYEAESPENTLTGNANIQSGNIVGNVGNNAGDLTFNKVNVPSAGEYDLIITYCTAQDRNLYVSVNGGEGTSYLMTSTGGWSASSDGTYAAKVSLNAGDNTIKLYNPNNGASISAQQYGVMRDALQKETAKTGRPIVFSICEWGSNQPWLWGPQVGNLWRTTGDISDSWNSMISITDKNSVLAQYAGPGHWNDPDMLEVGNGRMTDTEYQTHFSLWSIMAAPLIAGNDITNMSQATKDILLNMDVIAIDQDSLGVQGSKVSDTGDYEIWVKPLANGDKALLFLNRSGAPTTMSYSAKNLGLKKAPVYVVRDLWAHSEKATTDNISAVVPSHGVAMFRVQSGTPDMAQPATDFTISADNYLNPGVATKVTATFTNNGRITANDLKVNFNAPEGWTVSAGEPEGWTVNETSPTTFDNLPAGKSITLTWDVTAPADAAPASYDFTADASFIYGDYGLSGQQQVKTSVRVLPPPPSTDSFLSDMNWLEATNGWGPVERDLSNGESGSKDGHTITINGVTFAKGLGVHAQSEITYYIGGKFSNFTAVAGLDDEVGNNGSVTFEIWGDGQKLYDSKVATGAVTRGSSPAVDINVDVTNVKIIKLVVTNGGDDINYDHADWANAKILIAPSATN